MTWVVFSALLSFWKKKPLQLATLILGLAIATALWSGVQAINAEARKSYAEASDLIGGGGLVELRRKDNRPIQHETFIALRRAGWLVSPVIDGWLSATNGGVRLLGVDPLTFPANGGRFDINSPVMIQATVDADPVLFTNPATARRLSYTPYPVGELASIAPGIVIADISVAAVIEGKEGYSRLLLAQKQPLVQTPLEQIAPQLKRLLPDASADLGRLTDSFHLNLTAFGLLSFAVGLFIVYGAVGLAFEQRRPMFRTLRAMGVSARQLVCLLTAELACLALISGALGMFLGYLIAGALLPNVAATLRGLYGATVEGTLTLPPLWWLGGLGIALVGTAIASASSLLRIARMPPLASAKPRAWSMENVQALRWQIAGAVLCATIALGVAKFGSGLIAGFLLLGAFLISTALILPACLTAATVLAARLQNGPRAHWFWADTRQQLPGLSLALMALLLALSANIGVGTMVSSFRATFTGWLDQRLVSDLYVSAASTEEEATLRRFADQEGLTLLPIWHIDTELMNAPAEIYGVVDHAIYRDNWPMLSSVPQVWPRLFAGGGVLINEQLARRNDLTIGRTITLPGGTDTLVLGIYGDYGNPIGQAILPLDQLETLTPALDRSDFGILTASPTDTQSALKSYMGWDDTQIIDQRALKEFSLNIFERTFAVTGALNLLTLGVAAIAILTSLLTLSAMRLPQLAPVWALGMTAKNLAYLEILRTVVLATITFLISIPVGLGLAWVLLAVINVEAFGWRLPMQLFPAQWVWLGLISFVTAILAGLWPAWTLARRPPADLIRVFSQER